MNLSAYVRTNLTEFVRIFCGCSRNGRPPSPHL